jgi:uncharacterized protein
MNIQPILIDNIAFAKRREHLAGTFSLADCIRLSELLHTQAADNSKNDVQANDAIHYVLDGETDAMGQHFLHLLVTSNLTTICQRCLEPMPLKLNLKFDYLIGDNKINVEEMEESDDFDIQEASQAMDLVALIEDEMLMALPIAPVHESDCGATVMQSGDKPNPFAALKGLIKS